MPKHQDDAVFCHAPRQVDEGSYGVMGRHIVRRDGGVVAGAPPILAAANLRLAVLKFSSNWMMAKDAARKASPGGGSTSFVAPRAHGSAVALALSHAGGLVGPMTRPNFTSSTSSFSRVSVCSPVLAVATLRLTCAATCCLGQCRRGSEALEHGPWPPPAPSCLSPR